MPEGPARGGLSISVLALAASAVLNIAAAPARQVGCSGHLTSESQTITDPNTGQSAHYVFPTSIPGECDMSNSHYWSLQVVASDGSLCWDQESVYGFPGYDGPQPPPDPQRPHVCPSNIVLQRNQSKDRWDVLMTVDGDYSPSADPNAPPRPVDEDYIRMFYYAGGLEGLTSCLSHSILRFGRVEAGQSESRKVEVRNCGSGELAVAGASVLPDSPSASPSAFSVVPGSCAKATLSPGQSCQLTIVFAPARAGRVTAEIHVADDAEPEVIRVDGIGLGQPFVVLSPTNLDGSDVNPRDTGGLDFGSVHDGSTGLMNLTVTNGGRGPLLITKLSGTGAADFRPLTGSCVRHTIGPGDSCEIVIGFEPGEATHDERTGELVISDDAPGSPQYVSLRGTAIRSWVQRTSVGEDQGGNYDWHVCRGHGPRPKDLVPKTFLQLLRLSAGGRLLSDLLKDFQFISAGWAPLSERPAEIVGQVVEAHVASTDMVGVADRSYHQNSDLDMFVYPDQGYRSLLARRGNFLIGGDLTASEQGRMTLETETYNPLDPNRPGLPPWAWPTTGDKVRAIGTHIFDCGHGEPNFRSEIHPLEFIATYRDAALTKGASTGALGSYDPASDARATRVDVFATTYGGPAYGNEIDHRGEEFHAAHGPYTFEVMAPPKPTATAELAEPEIRFRGGLGGEISSTRLQSGRGYRFVVHLRNEPGASSGWTVWVRWRDPRSPDSLTARKRTFAVRVLSVRVLKRLTGRWSLYASVNENQTQSLTSGGVNLLRQTWEPIPEPTANTSLVTIANMEPLVVSVLDGQTLHVEFRITSWKNGLPLAQAPDFGPDLGSSQFAGTAGHVFTADELRDIDRRGVTETQRGSVELPNYLGADEIDDECLHGGCYRITYSVTRVP